MSLSACSFRSCSSRSLCSRAWRRFSARRRVASSRSVVPAIGLLGVTGGAVVGGAVGTVVSGGRSKPGVSTHGYRHLHHPCTPIRFQDLSNPLIQAKCCHHCLRLGLLWAGDPSSCPSALVSVVSTSQTQEKMAPLPRPPSLSVHLQGSLLRAAPSEAGLGSVRALGRALAKLGPLAPSPQWFCSCCGSCPQALMGWGSLLPPPSSEPAPWVMQWCFGGMVVLEEGHGLVLGWGRGRQVCARL